MNLMAAVKIKHQNSKLNKMAAVKIKHQNSDLKYRIVLIEFIKSSPGA